MTLREYINILEDYADAYGEDIEIVSFAHEETLTPSPSVFYDDEKNRIVTD